MILLLIFLSIITFSIGNKVQLFYKKDMYVKVFFYALSLASFIFSLLFFLGLLKSSY
jgi:hypothetical protein